MISMAQISNAVDSLSGLPAGLVFTPAALVFVGIYALLLLAGLAVDLVLVVRWLMLDNPPGTRSEVWAGGVACLQGRPWTWREAALLLLVLLGAQAAAQGARAVFVAWLDFPADSTALAVVCQALGFHGAGLAALAWSLRRRRLAWEQAFGMNWRRALQRAGQGLLGYLAILPPFFAVSLAYQLILFHFGYPLSMQNVLLFFMEPQSVGMLVFFFILAAVVAPLAEEALFRGVALPLLARSAGVIPAIALTAAGFALVHFHVPALAPLFVLAAGFAAAYIVTGSLWVPVVMHALFNGMNVGLILLLTPR